MRTSPNSKSDKKNSKKFNFRNFTTKEIEKKMASKREIKEAIANFITKVSTCERYIEIKRQLLCDMNDFEPYVAFNRLTRNTNSKELTEETILNFQKETLLQTKNYKIKRLIKHYSSKTNGKRDTLSYKDFLEIVLPREHPDLRAFITQRECFDISKEEYLGYQTEVSMANLIEQETNIFSELAQEKRRLDKINFNAERIINEIDKENGEEINFCNLQEYLNECGIVVYDFEIIGFMRRVDRDDDGVIKKEEFTRFLDVFDISGEKYSQSRRQIGVDTEALKSISPARKIVSGEVSLISKSRKSLLSSKSRELLRKANTSFSRSNLTKLKKSQDSTQNEDKSLLSFNLSSKRYNKALTVTSEKFKEEDAILTTTGQKSRNFTERAKEGNIFREKFNIAPKSTNRSNLSDGQSSLSSKYDRYANNLRRQKSEVITKETQAKNPKDSMTSKESEDPKLFGNLKDSTYIMRKQKSKKLFEKKEDSEIINPKEETSINNCGMTTQSSVGNLAYQRSLERSKLKIKEVNNQDEINKRNILKIEKLTPQITQSYRDKALSEETYEETYDFKRKSMGVLTSIQSSLYRFKNLKESNESTISVKSLKVKNESITPIEIKQEDKENSKTEIQKTNLEEVTSKTINAHDLPLQLPDPTDHIKDTNPYTYSYQSFKKLTPTKKLNFSSEDERNKPSHSKFKKNPLQEIKLHSKSKKDLNSRNSSKLEPELKQSITLTVQTSPTFKRPQSTARWADNDSMFHMKIESGMNSIKTPGCFENEEWRPNFDTNGLSPNQSAIDFNEYSYMNKVNSHASGITDESETPRTGFRRIFEDNFHPPKFPCIAINMLKKGKLGGSNREMNFENLEYSSTKNFTIGEETEESRTESERIGKKVITEKINGFMVLLVDLIKLERDFEEKKRKLALEENFSLKHTFGLICQENKEKFSLKDLEVFLKKNEIFETHINLIYLIEAFNYYDQSNNNMLSYTDLVEILSPVDQSLSLVLTQRNEKFEMGNFTPEVVVKLRDVFKTIFEIFKKIKEVKSEVKKIGLDLDVIFEELDLFGRGYLSKMDFERIIGNVDEKFIESKFDEIGLFVRRIDLDKDAKVNYKDFYLFFNN